MKLWNISKNRFYENAWLGFSHCSEIFWKLFLAFIGLFSQILGLVHLNLWCPFYVRNFSKFWVKVSIYIWVLSQLMGWILILWIFNDNSRNSAYFLHPYMLELPKLLNSNYLYYSWSLFCSDFSWFKKARLVVSSWIAASPS